jgi:sigma-B regulation protein RsbU (phosphoserine phosphatase)
MEEELQHERHVAELRERFIAVLGHDLRNPLAAIDAGLRLIQRDLTSAQAIAVMTMMKTSAHRMAKLIENTLDFARSRLGGGLELSRSTNAPLEPVLEQVITELRWSRPEARIETRIALTGTVRRMRTRLSFDRCASSQLAQSCRHSARAATRACL